MSRWRHCQDVPKFQAPFFSLRFSVAFDRYVLESSFVPVPHSGMRFPSCIYYDRFEGYFRCISLSLSLIVAPWVSEEDGVTALLVSVFVLCILDVATC